MGILWVQMKYLKSAVTLIIKLNLIFPFSGLSNMILYILIPQRNPKSNHKLGPLTQLVFINLICFLASSTSSASADSLGCSTGWTLLRPNQPIRPNLTWFLLSILTCFLASSTSSVYANSIGCSTACCFWTLLLPNLNQPNQPIRPNLT